MLWRAFRNAEEHCRTSSIEVVKVRRYGKQIAKLSLAGTYPLINCKLTIKVNTLEDAANDEDRAFMPAIGSKISFMANLFGDVRASSSLLNRQDMGNAKP